jgi:hypothetical protein
MHVNGFNVLKAAITGSVPAGVTTPALTTPAPTTSPASQTTSPTSPTGTGTGKSSSLSAGAAAGIAIGVVLLVLAAAAAGWFFYKRRAQGKQTYTPAMTSHEFAAGVPGLHELGHERGKVLVEVDGRSKAKSRVYELGS